MKGGRGTKLLFEQIDSLIFERLNVVSIQQHLSSLMVPYVRVVKRLKRGEIAHQPLIYDNL
jgi:hypothetical protein